METETATEAKNVATGNMNEGVEVASEAPAEGVAFTYVKEGVLCVDDKNGVVYRLEEDTDPDLVVIAPDGAVEGDHVQPVRFDGYPEGFTAIQSEIVLGRWTTTGMLKLPDNHALFFTEYRSRCGNYATVEISVTAGPLYRLKNVLRVEGTINARNVVRLFADGRIATVADPQRVRARQIGAAFFPVPAKTTATLEYYDGVPAGIKNKPYGRLVSVARDAQVRILEDKIEVCHIAANATCVRVYPVSGEPFEIEIDKVGIIT